jgi:general secretion pathway protein F
VATFRYQAAHPSGRIVTGTIDARDEASAISALQASRIYPLEVRPAAERRRWRDLLPRRGISGKAVLGFTQELLALLKAGVDLERALGMLAGLHPNRRFREILGRVRRDLHGGATFADALAQHPRAFSRLYVQMVRAGESGGALENVLGRLAAALASLEEVKEQLLTSLIYPVVLSATGGAAVAFLLTYVIPSFAQIFESVGQALPLPTRVLIGISQVVRQAWWLLAGGLAALVLAFRLAVRSTAGRMAWDRLKLRLPLIGPFTRKVEVARLARTLGTLLASGVPVLLAINTVKAIVGNRILAAAMDGVVEGVRKGAGMVGPLRESGVFPPLAVHMLSVGEETGRLDEMLLQIADTYDTSVRNALKRLLSLLEPAIIVVMGLVVGFVVLSILLAIFSVYDLPL